MSRHFFMLYAVLLLAACARPAPPPVIDVDPTPVPPGLAEEQARSVGAL